MLLCAANAQTWCHRRVMCFSVEFTELKFLKRKKFFLLFHAVFGPTVYFGTSKHFDLDQWGWTQPRLKKERLLLWLGCYIHPKEFTPSQKIFPPNFLQGQPSWSIKFYWIEFESSKQFPLFPSPFGTIPQELGRKVKRDKNKRVKIFDCCKQRAEKPWTDWFFPLTEECPSCVLDGKQRRHNVKKKQIQWRNWNCKALFSQRAAGLLCFNQTICHNTTLLAN